MRYVYCTNMATPSKRVRTPNRQPKDLGADPDPPAKQPQRKATTNNAEDEIQVVHEEAPAEGEDVPMEELQEGAPAPKKKRGEAEKAPAEPSEKKPKKPFAKASQVPTTDIRDQSGPFRYTEGVEFKGEGNTTLATVKVGDSITLPVPNAKRRLRTFTIVLLFMKYNAAYWRASAVERLNNGGIGQRFEFPLCNITAVLAGGAPLEAAQATELRKAAKSAVEASAAPPAPPAARAGKPKRRRTVSNAQERPAAPAIANIADLNMPISTLGNLVALLTNLTTECARLQDKQKEQLALLASKHEAVFNALVNVVGAHRAHHELRHGPAAAAPPAAHF